MPLFTPNACELIEGTADPPWRDVLDVNVCPEEIGWAERTLRWLLREVLFEPLPGGFPFQRDDSPSYVRDFCVKDVVKGWMVVADDDFVPRSNRSHVPLFRVELDVNDIAVVVLVP